MVAIQQGANFANVKVGKLELYFAYNTCIGFKDGCHARMLQENSWGPTTGKHLNALDDGRKEGRLDGSAFEKALAGVLGTYNLI